MILSYAYCSVAHMPVRSEPSHMAEMVNQVLLGEKLEILEINDNDWARICSSWDDYIGWCKTGQICIINIKEYRRPIKHLANGHHNRLLMGDTEMIVPMGANLSAIKKTHSDTAKYKGKKLTFSELELSPKHVLHAAMQYMNAPYLWGGRSISGIDCSGLTQMAFKLCGAALPRDAAQQAEEGELVGFLQHAHQGDLAFFDNAEGKITHVGILVDTSHILHATDSSGRVVIDKIDTEGIVSVSLRKRTHKLRMIRRYM